MSMYDLFRFHVGTDLGPILKSFILFLFNYSPVRFTIPSLIIDPVLPIGECNDQSWYGISEVWYDQLCFVGYFTSKLNVLLAL